MDIGIFLPIILSIISIIPLGMGIGGLMLDRRILSEGIETTAKVIRFRHTGNTAAPIVEYQTNEGLIQSKSWFGMSRFLYSFNEGDTILIRYDRDHPKRFRIVNSRLGTVLWGMCIFMGIVTLVMAVIIPELIA